MSFQSETELQSLLRQPKVSLFSRKRLDKGKLPWEETQQRPFSASRTTSVRSLRSRGRLGLGSGFDLRKRRRTSRTRKPGILETSQVLRDGNLLVDDVRSRSPASRQGEQTGALLSSLQQRVKELQAALELKDTELSHLHSASQSLETQLVHSQATVTSLESLLEAANQAVRSTESSLKDLEQREMQLEEQVQLLKNRETELIQTRTDEINRAKAELTTQLYEITKTLKNTQKTAAKREEKLHIQHMEVKKLRKEVTELKKCNEELKTEKGKMEEMHRKVMEELGQELAVVGKYWKEGEEVEETLARAPISSLAVRVIRTVVGEDRDGMRQVLQTLPEELQTPESEGTSDPSLLSHLHTLFRHIRFRLQLRRMTIFPLISSLAPPHQVLEAGKIRRLLSTPPIELLNTHDQQLIMLLCLKKPLLESNLRLSLDQEWITSERIREVFQANLGQWEPFSQEKEEEFDREIVSAIEPVAEKLQSVCEDKDSTHCGYVSEAEFLDILGSMDLHFNGDILHYLRLLFYSLDKELDRVPYMAFLRAYISEAPGRNQVLWRHSQAITTALRGRKARTVFAASVDGLITVAHFRAGLTALELLDIPQQDLEVLVEELRTEERSGLSLEKLERLLGVSTDSQDSD